MLDFYLTGDNQPYNSAVKPRFIGGIEEEKFEKAQTAKVFEKYLDYHRKFWWLIEVAKLRIIRLKQLNRASLSNLTDILKQAAAAECGLFCFLRLAKSYLHFSFRRVSMTCAIFQTSASFTSWNES